MIAILVSFNSQASYESLSTVELGNIANDVYEQMLELDPWDVEYMRLYEEYEYIFEILRKRALKR
mgnify:CR=1 FL=1